MRATLDSREMSLLIVDLEGIFPRQGENGSGLLLEKRFLPSEGSEKGLTGDSYLKTHISQLEISGQNLSLISFSPSKNWTGNPENLVPLRHLLYNLQVAHESYSWVILLLPTTWTAWHGLILQSSSLAWVWPPATREAELEVIKNLRTLENPRTLPLFWCGQRMDAKIWGKDLKGAAGICANLLKPHAYQIPRDGESLRKLVQQALYLQILKRNPPPSGVRFLLSTWWLIALLLSLLVMSFPLELDSPLLDPVHLRKEMRRHSVPPHIQFQFDGRETLQRISKYAIGRYIAAVPTMEELRTYMEEVRIANGEETPWRVASDGAIYPPAGRVLRFPPPQALRNPLQDSLAPAWAFFTSIISDSISYVTEYFNNRPTPGMRLHDGVDVGSRMGARILAPFSGRAWTASDPRAGVVIALVNDIDVLLFMHCDQLLYLDGQEVLAGDPLATVGLTGHTTGPHVHLATGRLDSQGPRRIGPLRYISMDPVEWYFDRKRRQQESKASPLPSDTAAQRSE